MASNAQPLQLHDQLSGGKFTIYHLPGLHNILSPVAHNCIGQINVEDHILLEIERETPH